MPRLMYAIEDSCELAATRAKGRLTKASLFALAAIFAGLGDTLNPRIELRDLFTPRH